MISLIFHWFFNGFHWFCPKQAADIFLSMSYIGRSPIKVGIRFKRKVSAFRIFCPIQNSLRSDEVKLTWKKISTHFFFRKNICRDFRKIEKSKFFIASKKSIFGFFRKIEKWKVAKKSLRKSTFSSRKIFFMQKKNCGFFFKST